MELNIDGICQWMRSIKKYWLNCKATLGLLIKSWPIVALSPSPCLRRVRALEKAIIRGYHASVDQEACDCRLCVCVGEARKPTEENMLILSSTLK